MLSNFAAEPINLAPNFVSLAQSEARKEKELQPYRDKLARTKAKQQRATRHIDRLKDDLNQTAKEKQQAIEANASERLNGILEGFGRSNYFQIDTPFSNKPAAYENQPEVAKFINKYNRDDNFDRFVTSGESVNAISQSEFSQTKISNELKNRQEAKIKIEREDGNQYDITLRNKARTLEQLAETPTLSQYKGRIGELNERIKEWNKSNTRFTKNQKSIDRMYSLLTPSNLESDDGGFESAEET